MSNRTYTAHVVEEDGELLLVFPQSMLEDLGWAEGDNIVWEIDENNRAVIARKEGTNAGDDA